MWRLVHGAITSAAAASKPDVCIGIALYPSHAGQPRELLQRAQLAAASARERGERLLLSEDGDTAKVLQRWHLADQFAAALECGEIDMYYQPKIGIATGRPAGAEALMRWMREGRAVATPDVFIPLAEETGLIDPATWLSLNAGLRHASEWPGATALGVAVNISPGVLHHRELVEMVQRALAAWSLPSERLTLEITEGALIADLQEATNKLRRLRDLGVRISIDDFGTGYSSLSYFKKIPADELKIDKSFVLRMREDEDDERIVRAIVGLAQHFRLAVVAEGVEDEATLDVLAAMGCDYAQGFLFSRALQQSAFLTWLESA
jgi:EAL domain-containing protein (putative c-di-GMP-specific phosphodiesterase class I)